MLKRKAIYAGTFDPLTNGHMWMIERTARLFDEVVVAIGLNPDKKFLFTREERVEVLRAAVAHIPNVKVDTIDNQFLVEYAREKNIDYFVRGIRNPNDYEFERVMRQVNADIGSAETIMMMPPREMGEISSTVVKGLVGPSGWTRVVERYVPRPAFKALVIKHFGLVELLKRNAQRTFDAEREAGAIVDSYLEDGRAYHTIHHIASILEDFRHCRGQLDDADAVELAIWYHDVIYSTKPPKEGEKSNEELSAERAYLYGLRADMPQTFCQKVDRLILATRHLAVPTDKDESFLVDFDLAILGKPAHEFDEYERAIRTEYEWVDEKYFRTKRAEILEGFAERDPLFQTVSMRERYEARAKENLARSINALRGR